MGKGDGQRPRFVPYDQYASNYDRIFGEQRAPASEEVQWGFDPARPDPDVNPAAWDDAECDKHMECLDCMQAPCNCDWQRIEDEYRDE